MKSDSQQAGVIGSIVQHKQHTGFLAEFGDMPGLVEMRLRPVVLMAVLQNRYSRAYERLGRRYRGTVALGKAEGIENRVELWKPEWNGHQPAIVLSAGAVARDGKPTCSVI